MEIISSFLNTLVQFAPKIPLVLLGLLVGWMIIKFIVWIIRRTMRLARVPKDIIGLAITLIKFILWVVLLGIIASALGLNSLFIYLSGSAAVVAFFLSASIGPTLSNVFSGLFLAGDPDIKVGMTIRTNDGKTEGLIKGVDMRKVRIEDDKGIMHIVPNSIVENGEWIVLDRGTKGKK
jgi:small conductance mechanosensitive channel